MFQNIAYTSELNKEEVELNNKRNYKLEKIKEIFRIQNIIIYVLSFLVSIVSIREGLSPFAFAFFVAACSSSIPAGPVLGTTILGTIISQGPSGILTFILEILFFLLTIIFLKPYVQDDRNEVTKLGRNLIISSIIVQAIKLFTGTFLIYDAINSILVVIFTYVFYKIFVNSIGVLENFGLKTAFTIEEVIGATIIVAIASVSLGEYRFYGISIANILSIFLILVLSWKNGLLVGSTIGVTLGLVLGIVGYISPIQVLAFSISGLLAGSLCRLGRPGVIVGFLIGNTIISYLTTGNTLTILLYRELIIAGAMVLFVPKYFDIDIEDLVGKGTFFSPVPDNRLTASTTAENKLDNLSETINEIAKSYGIKPTDVEYEVENINKSKEAFVEDLLNNLDAFPNNILYEDLISLDNDLIENIYLILIEKEEITEKDLVELFEKRNEILDIESDSGVKEDVSQVVRIINRTYRINEMNFQWKQRLQDNKKNISKQLEGVSKAISEIADGMTGKKDNNYTKKETEVKELLKQKEILAKEVKIRQDRNKKYFIDILFEKYIKEKEKVRCIESILSKVCKEKIVFQKDTSNINSKLYMQKYISANSFSLQLGLAQVSKTGNDVCGDSCIQIKLEDNKHLVALSDGMGSGAQARKSSQIVVKLLKKTLLAGFDKEDSLELINSTINVSSEEIYATMDVAVFDLYKGVVEFIKNGACKTYIKNRSKLECVGSNSLPLGILNDVDFTVYDRDLVDGDVFIICSDGIVDSSEQSEDKWLVKLIKEVNTNNVKKLADMILREAIDNSYGIAKDDMTVIVGKVSKI